MKRARLTLPAAAAQPEPILRDEIPLFLANLVRALSPNEPQCNACSGGVCKEHGQQRARQKDYSLRQVLAEYSLLQKTILEVIEVEMEAPLQCGPRDTILESIALGMEEAGVEFAKQQLAQLKSSNEALENFGYTASHDLQEPLRGISLQLGALQKKLGNKIDPDIQPHFDFVLDSTRRMKSLIDSLLVFSQVGRAEEAITPTDFNLALKNATTNLSETIKDNQASVTAGPLPTMAARPVEIERLFQNLIGNAIKFRGKDAPRVHISAAQGENKWIFSVADNGIGISAEHREKVFVLFTRLHSKFQYPGSGIGLSVCRRVVELHGGKIWAEENAGGGTTFKFTIHGVALALQSP